MTELVFGSYYKNHFCLGRQGFSVLCDIKTEKHITRLAKDQTYHNYLPVGATSSTALHKQCKETILVNKEGNSWNVSLRFSESAGKYYITRGWRKFCLDNRCGIGDLFAFNVVGDGKTTPLMCVCPERKECSEILSKYLSRTSGEYPDLSPTIPPRPTGTGGSWRPNGNHVKSAVAGPRTRDGRHLSRGSYTTRPRGPVKSASFLCIPPRYPNSNQTTYINVNICGCSLMAIHQNSPKYCSSMLKLKA
ncbi:hypothetical protein YC2023_078984 [Brassica napus]